jgi:hypothetical protein
VTGKRKPKDQESEAWSRLTSGRAALEADMTKRDLKYATGSINWVASFERIQRPRPLQ